MSSFDFSPQPSPKHSSFDGDDEDDAASQRSIPLSSPAGSPRQSAFEFDEEEHDQDGRGEMEELDLNDHLHSPQFEPKTPRPNDIHHAHAVPEPEDDPDIVDTDVSSEDDASIFREVRQATRVKAPESLSILGHEEVEHPEPTPMAYAGPEPVHPEPEPDSPLHDVPMDEEAHVQHASYPHEPEPESELEPAPDHHHQPVFNLHTASDPDPENFFSTVSSEVDERSLYTTEMTDHDTEYTTDKRDSSITSAVPSFADEPPETPQKEEDDMKGITLSPLSPSLPLSPIPALPSTTTYPPPPIAIDTDSITDSITSGTSKKARPESLLVEPGAPPLVLGVALVDFNHLVGPRIEFSRGDIFEDEEIAKILPFLALPDGAHLATEDYSYFHVVPSNPSPTTVFGISCNRQIQSSELLAKSVDVTRSTVQKAVVVLASKPLFGPIRDKLGVVTRALFHQRDFGETGLLDDFYSSLEGSLRAQLTESSLYMGTSLRELVHTFRQRTLVLVKALILQKRILFYGHPVEKLCTHQYSLVSLFPGLLQTLEDCGSPPLASREPTLRQPDGLKTSDRKSLMAYLGLPLDIFGKDAFFQPYLPLQQMDMLKETHSWLCGTTNSIVTQQKELDLLVNIETNTFEFRDPNLERVAGLTPADRKWMDDIVKDVNDSWVDGDPEARGIGLQGFKGSDDYLRTKFEEYIHAALGAVKFADFLQKGKSKGVMISDGTGADAMTIQDFNPVWMAEFRRSHAYEVWNRITDPMLFDIAEPRHPCGERVSVVTDIGLRLSEGIQDLKIDQQLAPAREAISRTISTGSTSFFKAVDGVRGKWLQRTPSGESPPPAVPVKSEASASASASSSTVELSKSDAGSVRDSVMSNDSASASSSASRPTSIATQATPDARASLGSWGSGLGSFLSSRAARFSMAKQNSPTASSPVASPARGSVSSQTRSSVSSSPPPESSAPVSSLSSFAISPSTSASSPLRSSDSRGGEEDEEGMAGVAM